MDCHIRNLDLDLGRLPLESADWDEINEFAHTFDGYTEWGSFDRCAEIAKQRCHDTLTNLRTCLFFEARSWRHGSEDPQEQDMVYLRGLVRQIREKVSNANFT